MSAQAQAALDALSGYTAYDVHGDGRQLWIWDGVRGRYYYDATYTMSERSDHALEYIEHVTSDGSCEWIRVPVPAWFKGHEH